MDVAVMPQLRRVVPQSASENAAQCLNQCRASSAGTGVTS
jgi:hypothetical protein